MFDDQLKPTKLDFFPTILAVVYFMNSNFSLLDDPDNSAYVDYALKTVLTLFLVVRFIPTLYFRYKKANLKKWKTIAEKVYKEKNYQLSEMYYQKALKYGDDNYLEYSLGWLYENTKELKDIELAKIWYEKAMRHGSDLATEQLLIIEESTNVGRSNWCGIGEKYYYGRDGREVSYKKAKVCYELSVKKELNAFAEYNLGWLYEHGLDVPCDLESALKYYKQSLNNGYTKSKEQILKVELKVAKSAKEYYELGEKYYHGRGVSLNYSYARQCYEKALEREFHIDATYRLGDLYHYGKGGISINYATALVFYRVAAAKGHRKARLQLTKLLAIESSRREAIRYYNKLGFIRWGFSLINPSTFVKKLGYATVVPVSKLLDRSTGLSFFSPAAKFGVNAISFCTSPFTYVGTRITNSSLKYAIDRLELTNPGLKATLMLAADLASESSTKAAYSFWGAPPTHSVGPVPLGISLPMELPPIIEHIIREPIHFELYPPEQRDPPPSDNPDEVDLDDMVTQSRPSLENVC